MEGGEDASDIFRTITEGGLNQEQLEKFKLLKRLTRNWVISGDTSSDFDTVDDGEGEGEAEGDDELDDEDEDPYVAEYFADESGIHLLPSTSSSGNGAPTAGPSTSTGVRSSRQPLPPVPAWNHRDGDGPFAGPSSSAGGPVPVGLPQSVTMNLLQKQRRQQELTDKYINGELSFTEFTDLADANDDYYDDEDEDDLDDSYQQEENRAIDEPGPPKVSVAVKTKKEAMNDDSEGGEDDADILSYEDNLEDEDYMPPGETRTRSRKRAPSGRSPAKAKGRRSQSAKSKMTDMFSLKGEQEFHDELRLQRKRRRRDQLPRDLQGLVGEANLCFARGEHEDAVKMCMEVIRLAPRSPQPFQTLGMIYEELGDSDKSLQFSLIAAYLCPNDPDEWIRMAEMSLEKDNIKQAITCYGQAIRCESSNIDLMWTRCRLFEQIGDTKKVFEQLNQILKCVKPDDVDNYIQASRELTKMHYDRNNVELALATMEKAVENYSGYITSEDVNLLLQLQMKQKMYLRSIQVLCEHCGITFTPPMPEWRRKFGIGEDTENDDSADDPMAIIQTHLTVATQCFSPEVLPIDLCVKLIVCLIQLGVSQLAKSLVGTLLQENPEEMGDLYLDVAEAYMDRADHDKAVTLLAALSSSERYNLAEVWLRYAECLHSLGKLEDSVWAYRRVLDLAPSHYSARMVLSGLLQQLGFQDEALTILAPENDDCNVQLEPNLLQQRCKLLYARGLYDEFIEVAKLLHSSHMVWLSSEEEEQVTAYGRGSRKIRDYLRDYRDGLANLRKEDSLFTNNAIPAEDIWDIFKKMCDTLLKLNRLHDLETLVKSYITSKVFFDDITKVNECEFMRLLACYMNGNMDHAFFFAKQYLLKNPNNNVMWNLFNQIVTKREDLRHNRFCLRLMYKHQDNLALGMINGHTALVAGSYKHALGEYINVYKVLPKDPLIALCIAIVYIHMTSQKFTGNKHSILIQGCAFINQYLEIRGETQESYYNIGRAMHQLSLTHVAEYYYKKGLALEPAIPTTPETDMFDLKREMAFNLSLIYLAANSPDLAKMYTNKYCVM